MAVALDARLTPRLSIVAPCYNEEIGLEEFHRRMASAAHDTVGSDYEFVLLNDGSSDRTWAIMADLVRRDPRVVAVNLSRRHGHQLAITAGLYTCRGDRILTIDADLQDPPELLSEMWRLMDSAEADVVYGLRRAGTANGSAQVVRRQNDGYLMAYRPLTWRIGSCSVEVIEPAGAGAGPGHADKAGADEWTC